MDQLRTSPLAGIDIGTNTILLLVADVGPGLTGHNQVTKVYHDEQTMVRLGQGVNQNRNFAPDAMERAYACLKKYKDICNKFGVLQIRAVATSASRDARNSAEFYKRIEKDLGIHVEIISGEEEARASFLGGLVKGYDPLSSAILDIGGGSTEFVIADSEPKKPNLFKIEGQSLDIGSVRATEMFLQKRDPYNKADLTQMEDSLKKYWKQLRPFLQKHLRDKEWIGVAGTVTTLAGIALNLKTFDVEKLHGYRFNRCDLSDIYESLAVQLNEQRARNPMIGSGRADVITAGAAILLSAMEYFEKDTLVVSISGLRYGILL